jgi:hypothetical protein
LPGESLIPAICGEWTPMATSCNGFWGVPKEDDAFTILILDISLPSGLGTCSILLN